MSAPFEKTGKTHPWNRWFLLYYIMASDDAITRTCTTAINRKNSLIFNIPGARYTPTNPYELGFTKEQLDMRRKAEVLQYNKLSNGKITNNKRWVNVVNGKEQRRKYSSYDLRRIADGNGEPCQSDLYIPTLTTESGVPGPPIYLQYDPTIPLYNYSSQQAAYGTQTVDNITKWLLAFDTDIRGNTAKVTTLNVQPGIDAQFYNYSLTTSIAFDISGTCTQDSSFNVNIPTQNIILQIKYGNQPVLMRSNPTVAFDAAMDVSGSAFYNSTVNGAFSGTIYMGNMTISNIVLPATPGNTYDFIITYVPSYDDGLHITTFGVNLIYNLKDQTISQNYLSFTKGPSLNPKQTLIVTGISL